MKSDLEIEGLRAAPGAKTRGFIDLADGPAGVAVRAPVILVNGVHEGPTLLVASGVHGDDLNTVPMTWRLAEEVNPAELKGQLVLAPVVNPLAFEAGSHLTPADNATPSFPGSASGTISQRIGASFYDKLVVRADYVLDMHGGSKNATLAVLASLDGGAPEDVLAVARGMAEAFQPEVIVVHESNGDHAPTGLMQAASRRGAPGVYLGMGQMGFNEADTVRGVWGVKNIMKHLGMLPGAPQAAAVPPPYTRTELYQRTPFGGGFYPAVKAGQAVAVDDLLGSVRDIFGQPAGEVRAQVAGIVDAIRFYPVVSAGDWVASIARW